MLKKFTLYCLFFNLFAISRCWHLSQVGLNESYRILHLSTHFSRVFLSITVESQRFPTLIESLWPESYLPIASNIFPRTSIHANGDHKDCTKLQQAHWSQVDSLSRLWVMDVGWTDGNDSENGHVCPPKLFVFDLIRNNVEVSKSKNFGLHKINALSVRQLTLAICAVVYENHLELKTISIQKVLIIDCSKYIAPGGSKILTIKLGPPSGICGIEKYIYFILADDSHILAYDIIEQTWQSRKLLSRKYDSVDEALPIQPMDFAFGKDSNMLISDADGVLYSTNNALLLDSISAVAFNNTITKNGDKDIDVELDLLGSLLGPSKGMMLDIIQDALFYIVPKFGAVVRCEPKSNLTAEGNEIIYMTSRNVQQLFFGDHGSVWLLSDRWLSPQDHCFPA